MRLPHNLLYLSERKLERLRLKAGEIADTIEALYRAHNTGSAWSAPKAVIHHTDGRYMMATLSAADEPSVLVVKALLLNPRNAARGMSTINSLITVLDGETGAPLAVMDGNWVTAHRTAALSMVAARRLARRESSVAAFIGCGVQAKSHLRAFADAFPLTEIRAFGRGTANRDSLCRLARRLKLQARACESAESCVRDADLVVSSVTMMPTLVPFIDGHWLKPGAFATVIDLAAPWMPHTMTAFDRIVIDDCAQEAVMAKPMIAMDIVSGDLAGLVRGDVAVRRNAKERTAFVFRGIAFGDLAAAALAYQRARGEHSIPRSA
jgi:ornithine cyclodeaminase/alanine dehydrogenase